MDTVNIKPSKVTRPIQLLAAWFTALVAIDGAFLTAATRIDSPEWASGLLVISAIVNVPIFLAAMFSLQTRFRPEMQEDKYYSKYLEEQYQLNYQTENPLLSQEDIDKLAEELKEALERRSINTEKDISRFLTDNILGDLTEKFRRSRALEELHTRRYPWMKFVDRWRDDKSFEWDIHMLKEVGLLTMKNNNLETAQLSMLGKNLVEKLAAEDELWINRAREKDELDNLVGKVTSTTRQNAEI